MLLATVGGDLDCTDAKFNAKVAEPNKYAIYAGEATVAGSVVLSRVTAEGLVRLRAIKIGAYLICSAGHFFGSGPLALDAKDANIEGTVYLDNRTAATIDQTRLDQSDIVATADNFL
jgi:hypothetical protein